MNATWVTCTVCGETMELIDQEGPDRMWMRCTCCGTPAEITTAEERL